MELLANQTVESYMQSLSSNAPAPGGGAAAALAGAQGASLALMVCALSIGRKKYAEHEAALLAAQSALQPLAQELLGDIDRDTQAYDAVSAAMKLPKETGDEKAHRQAEIQKALLAAIRSPLSVCKRSLQALQAMEPLVGRSNINAVSDLGTGAAMLRAAVQGAWLNILINLSSLKDTNQAQALRDESEPLCTEAIALADRIYQQVQSLTTHP